MKHDLNNTTPGFETDKQLDALLDEAFAPEQPREQMIEQIITTTAPMLRDQPATAQPQGKTVKERPAVIARLGVQSTLWRIAAVLLIVAGAGYVMLSSGMLQINPGGPENANLASSGNETKMPTVTEDTDLDVISADLRQLALADQTALFDQQLELLEMQLELVESADPWSGADTTLEEAMLQYELEEFMEQTTSLF